MGELQDDRAANLKLPSSKAIYILIKINFNFEKYFV